MPLLYLDNQIHMKEALVYQILIKFLVLAITIISSDDHANYYLWKNNFFEFCLNCSILHLYF